MSVSETVEITGHLMDSGILSRVLDDIREYGGDCVIDQIRRRPRGRPTPVHARRSPSPPSDDEQLQRLLMRLQTRGVNQVDPGEAESASADLDGVFPDGFYSTTNLETRVRLDGHVARRREPRDGLRAGRRRRPRVYTLPMSDVRAGMKVVMRRLRHQGHRARRSTSAEGGFGFMESDVSSEKPQAVLVRQVADGMREAKAAGKKVLWVGGPGVVHTGAAPAMVALVDAGLRRRAVRRQRAGHPRHRVRRCTAPSLGVDLAMGRGVEHGHEHHIRALNTIRKAGLDPRPPSTAAC